MPLILTGRSALRSILKTGLSSPWPALVPLISLVLFVPAPKMLSPFVIVIWLFHVDVPAGISTVSPTDDALMAFATSLRDVDAAVMVAAYPVGTHKTAKPSSR